MSGFEGGVDNTPAYGMRINPPEDDPTGLAVWRKEDAFTDLAHFSATLGLDEVPATVALVRARQYLEIAAGEYKQLSDLGIPVLETTYGVEYDASGPDVMVTSDTPHISDFTSVSRVFREAGLQPPGQVNTEAAASSGDLVTRVAGLVTDTASRIMNYLMQRAVDPALPVLIDVYDPTQRTHSRPLQHPLNQKR